MMDDQDSRPYDCIGAVKPENKEEFIRKAAKVKPEMIKLFKVSRKR